MSTKGIIFENCQKTRLSKFQETANKLKSLKVAQLKDEMDDDEDDGCDVAW